jgi:hypothetical protein
MASRQIVVNLVGDASKYSKAFDAELNQAESRIKKFSAGAKLAMAGIGLAVTAGVKSSISAASDLQQSMGGLDAVFGASAAKVKAWSDGSAKAVGCRRTTTRPWPRSSARNCRTWAAPRTRPPRSPTTSSGSARTWPRPTAGLRPMPCGRCPRSSRARPTRSSATACPSSNPTSTPRLAADGQSKLTGTARKTAVANAALALITQQTSAAHGQWAAQTGTVAEKQQTLAAQVTDLKAKLGDKLLPVVASLTGGLTSMVTFLEGHQAAFNAAAVGVGVLTVAVLGLNVALWAMSLTPVGLVITGIVAGVVALAAGFTYAWQKSETFRKVIVAG